MSATETDSPLDQLPPPLVIHQHMGRLYRQLALLRRLLRLSQAARADHPPDLPERKGACSER
jgi:hypothetical protein